MSRAVAIATHYWAPHTGGVETVAGEQARRLAARGWEVDVFTSRLVGDACLERHGAVTVHRYASLNWQERGLHVPVPLPVPAMAAALSTAARRVDAVIAHGHAYPASGYAAWAARRRGRRFVLVQHNPFVAYPPVLQAVERAVDATLGRFLLHQAERVLCVSRHTEEYVARIAPRATTSVVYSGVDTERFRPLDPPGRPGLPRVLTLRRLVPRNGVEDLVAAWRQADLSQHAELVVAGEGPLRDRLQRRAGSDPGIRFLGAVAAADLADLYRSASIFVLPTRTGEGFGLAAAEALACGVPVVATDAGATGELVRHGVDGYVVPAGTRDALSSAIGALLRDERLRLSLASAAASRRPHLGWERAIDELERTILGHSPEGEVSTRLRCR